jgi:hypothetical protein
MSKINKKELNKIMLDLKCDLKTNVAKPSKIIVKQFIALSKYDKNTAIVLAKSILDALINDAD